MSSIAVETSAQDPRWRSFQQQVPWAHQQHQHHVQRQIHLHKLNSSGEEASESSETQEPSPPSSVDSSEKTPEEKLQPETETWEHFEAQPTFLGTTVWEKRIPFDGQDFKLEYVDLEDFLAENASAIPVSHPDSTFGISKVICHPSESNSNSNLEPSHQPFIIDHQFNIGISKTLATPPHSSPHLSSHLNHNSSRSSSPSDSSASATSRELSPDATQSQPPVPSATPGHEFDPSSRVFSQAELKPQPIIKKSRKQFVPNEQKDAKYWVRRRKNNMAAKRSRDARRVKENQIAMRACFLENENHILKEEIERIQQENHRLKEEISRCHAEHH